MSDYDAPVISPIPEEGYAVFMDTRVAPAMKAICTDSYFDTADGKKIHYVFYAAQRPVGSVVIAHGFTESAEKFLEMSFYYVCAGFNVFALDHRGHGYSTRDIDEPSLVYVNKFSDYVDDLDCFVQNVVKPASGRLPLYLYAHSMGGAIAVLYLQNHPGEFKKTVLTAPMISPNTANLPHPITRIISNFFVLTGQGKKAVLGSTPFNPDRTFENSNDTSRARFDYYQAKRCATPQYQTSSPTYRWVQQSLKIVRDLLEEGFCEDIDCPILLFQAETDGSVLKPAQNRFIKLVPHGTLVEMKGSKHEIYLSTNDVMQKYLRMITEFFYND